MNISYLTETNMGMNVKERLCYYVINMSQGRKKHMARPGLEPRTSRTPCEHSDHWATEPHGRPVTIPPCLIRFVHESARNHARTDDTVPLLLAAQARTHNEPPNVAREEKAHGPTGTRTQDILHTVPALWLLSYWATWSACDKHLIFPFATNNKYMKNVSHSSILSFLLRT